MSCAACSARVEGAVSALGGVEECTVNLLTGEMTVLGDVSPDSVRAAVEAAGYGIKETDTARTPDGDELADIESPRLIRRLVLSLGFLALLMYIAMGRMIGLPQPPFLLDNPLLSALIQLVLALAVMIINIKFFISGVKGAIHLAPNMDTLVSLGSFTSFAYSTYIVVLMATASGTGVNTMHYLHELYFESAAMILAFITVGKLLEAKAKGRTTSALRSLIELRPRTATVNRGGELLSVSVDELRVGDEIVVRAGERIPTDAVIISGEGALDESALSGESMPVDKAVGAKIFGATILLSGYIVARVSSVGEDTALSGIIRMVKEASSTKAPIAKLADRVSGVFVPTVLVISLITFIGWMIAMGDIGYAVGRAISVLVISCPCALGLATPVAIMVGSGVGAKRGILFKNATSLEESGRITTVVLDKTGTVTTGKMSVVGIKANDERLLVSLATAIEQYSEHPLGRAIVEYTKNLDKDEIALTGFETLSGRGVCAKTGDNTVYGVSLSYAEGLVSLAPEIKAFSDELARSGATPLVFILGDEVIGVIGVADTPKQDAKSGISALRALGMRVVMLTGDNEITANEIAKSVGIDEVIAGVLPEGKGNVIRELRKFGKVAMVGDGINDAPALTEADVGIAVGCGTDIAIEAADVVLMKDRLSDVATALEIGNKVLWNIRENLLWAFLYNCIGIPMAAGLFGLAMSPMLGALAMSLSSVSVVLNALRLNLFKPRAVNGDYKKEAIAPNENTENTSNINKKTEEKEQNQMTKVIKVEGMMCPHCEARVKKCAEGIPGIAEATPSHKEGTVTLNYTEGCDLEAVYAAIEAQGYPVTEK